jgi:hypothetical protein
MGSWLSSGRSRYRVWNGHVARVDVRFLYVTLVARLYRGYPMILTALLFPLNAPLSPSLLAERDTTRRVSRFTIQHRIQASSFIMILARPIPRR